MPSLHTLHPFLRAARILPVARAKTVMTAVLATIGMMGMLLAPTMQAQEFPSKPVRIIVTFTQGGAADITGRIFADRLADLWKQQVVVEKRRMASVSCLWVAGLPLIRPAAPVSKFQASNQ